MYVWVCVFVYADAGTRVRARVCVCVFVCMYGKDNSLHLENQSIDFRDKEKFI